MSIIHAYIKLGKFPELDYQKLAKHDDIIDLLEAIQMKIVKEPSGVHYICQLYNKYDMTGNAFAVAFDEAVKEYDGTNYRLGIASWGVIGWILADSNHQESYISFNELMQAEQSSYEECSFYRSLWINHIIKNIKAVKQSV